MGKRLNPALENIALKKELKRMHEVLLVRENTAVQMGKDAACMAAATVLQLGAGRAKAFCDAYDEAMLSMLHSAIEETETTEYARGAVPDIEYTRTKIDARILEIVGPENFEPWEERYCWNDINALMETSVGVARVGERE